MSAQQRLRFAAILNPAAGSDGEQLIADLAAREAVEVRTFTTTAPGDAPDIAYKLAADAEPVDAVVSVGGDGTVFEVVTGLWRAREAGVATPPLLVAPGGTGNSVYRGLWNDASWDRGRRPGDARAGGHPDPRSRPDRAERPDRRPRLGQRPVRADAAEGGRASGQRTAVADGRGPRRHGGSWCPTRAGSWSTGRWSTRAASWRRSWADSGTGAGC
ncbi:hypothetical protein LT493_06360 [Streptomyces tricolor]|nr:hypothetical protein [Streptomyces tricolor]